MLILDESVPAALILPEPVSDLQNHLQDQEAYWFSAQDQHLSRTDEGAVTAMHCLTRRATAGHTRANRGNSLLEDQGLRFRDATPCGFTVPELDADPTTWSCAVRFQAPGDTARTLMTLNPGDTDNYVFLQQVMGQMIFKDQQAVHELTCEATSATASYLVLAGMSQDRLWLRAGDSAIIHSTQAPLPLEGPLSLFVGCRNNKGRLQKTLGSFYLQDLVFWPGLNVLEKDHATTREALAQPSLWRPKA